MTTRRDFLRTSAAASGVFIAGGTPALASAAERAASLQSRASLNILILGGTGFIGPHIVNAALARGHKVATFTRGRRDGSMLPKSVEQLIGDRAVSDSLPTGNLRSIAGRKWDVVFDDSASNQNTAPQWVTNTTELLKDAGAYMFVSSTGVFLPYLTPNNAETDPVLTQPRGAQPEYGTSKAQCEAIVMKAFGARGYVVRPGYIVGPGDTTNRFPYWPQRIARGGEILAPGRKTDPSQLIDVRDLTEFMVKVVEDKNSGIYNVAGPAEKIGFGTFMEQAVAALNPSAQLTWCDHYGFLQWQRITYAVPWMIPEGDNKHHMDINNRKAVAAGLRFRSIATTVRDTYEWWKTVPEQRKTQAESGPGAFAISRDTEARALAAWKAGNPPPRQGRGGD
jgi:2'-hydroxyisoflavone reductase